MILSFPLCHAFLALPLKGESKDAFRDIQSRLQEYEEIFRFQNSETAHLTLHFFGTLMQIEYAEILRKAEMISARMKQFTLQVTGTGVFEGRDPSRVLFLTIDRSEDLSKLKKLCPWPNKTPFFPHITLARMKNPMSFVVHRKKIMKLLKDVSFSIPVTCLRLYAEIDGEQQIPIQDFSLGSL